MSTEASSSISQPLIGQLGTNPSNSVVQPRPLPSLPSEIWAHVMTFQPDPRTMGRMAQTCRFMKQVVDEERELFNSQVKSHPYLKHVIDHSSLISPNQSYKQKMPILDRYVKFANKVGKIANGQTDGGHYAHLIFSRDVEAMRRALEAGIATTPIDPRESIRGLAKLTKSVTLDDFFLAAVMMNDENLIQSFNLEVIDRRTVDFAAYFCLLQDKLDLFQKMLPHTSIYGEDPRQPQGNAGYRLSRDVLNTFLKLAAERNDLATFRRLLDLNRPYQANRLFVDLARANNGGAIAILLERAEVNSDFIADNGYNRRHSGTSGLHTALLEAANRNNQDALNAILQARPGQQIDRQILEHIRDLFQNDPLNQDQSDLLWREWGMRQNHPDRQGIINRMNQEIEMRYPGPAHLLQEQEAIVHEEAVPANLPVHDLPVQPQQQAQIVLPPEEHRMRRETIAAIAIALIGTTWNLYSWFFASE